MDKNANISTNANKDTFKNQPYAGGSANVSAQTGETRGSDMKGAEAKTSMTDIKGKAADMKNAIVDQAAPAVDYLKKNFSNVGEFSQDYIQNAGSLIRRYPFYSLLGAVAVGAVVGMAIARPSSSSNR